MKKIRKIAGFIITMVLTLSLTTNGIMAQKVMFNDFQCEQMYIQVKMGGRTIKDYKKAINYDKPYKKIVRTYKQLTKLKKYIKNHYYLPKKYLKKLKKYDKKYFKKNALIFVTEIKDMNCKDYNLTSIEKNGKNVLLKVDCHSTLGENQLKVDAIIPGANTYFISVKKSKIKKVKKIKVKYGTSPRVLPPEEETTAPEETAVSEVTTAPEETATSEMITQ